MGMDLQLSRRSVLAASATSAFAVAGLGVGSVAAKGTSAEGNCTAGTPWRSAQDIKSTGWSPAKLAELEAKLYPMATTSMMVVRDGEIVYTYATCQTSVTSPQPLTDARKLHRGTYWRRE